MQPLTMTKPTKQVEIAEPSAVECQTPDLFHNHQTMKGHTMSTIKIMYINNDGGGFADTLTIAANLSVADFFADRVPHGQSADYLIRVNRQLVTSTTILQDGDRVSITPTKIEGALL